MGTIANSEDHNIVRYRQIVKPSSTFLTDRSKAVLLLWILFVIVFCFVILSCLFLAALCSPAGKGLVSWLSCVWCFFYDFAAFSRPRSGVVLDFKLNES